MHSILSTLMESNTLILMYERLENSSKYEYVIRNKTDNKVLDSKVSYREAKIRFYELVPKLELELYGLKSTL